MYFPQNPNRGFGGKFQSSQKHKASCFRKNIKNGQVGKVIKRKENLRKF